MTHSQTNSNMHPETQQDMILSLAEHLAQADAYLMAAAKWKWECREQERAGALSPTDRATHGALFYSYVSACMENVYSVLAARDMFARVDAGLCSMEDIGHDDETLDPETLAEAEALAVKAELTLSQINSLIN